jgi:3-hydroxybutyryl-CoA dehydrogenase
MKILAIGDNKRLEEFRLKTGEGQDIDFYPEHIDLDEIDLNVYDAIFDLNLDDSPERLEAYMYLQGKLVIGCAVKIQLAEMVYHLDEKPGCNLFGMNCLPSFINRSLVEFSAYDEANKQVIDKLCSGLGWEFKIVSDRVGMVTPRIVLMIINEAFYTLQEGTASEKDIDESMKLGTNYPFGPFEWCEKIGIAEVYETLDSLYLDTHDERYKICSLLKTRYLKHQK